MCLVKSSFVFVVRLDVDYVVNIVLFGMKYCFVVFIGDLVFRLVFLFLCKGLFLWLF